MTSSPKQNAIITLFIQIIRVRIYWQVFLAVWMLSKIPSQTEVHNTILQVSLDHKKPLQKSNHLNMFIALCSIYEIGHVFKVSNIVQAKV